MSVWTTSRRISMVAVATAAKAHSGGEPGRKLSPDDLDRKCPMRAACRAKARFRLCLYRHAFFRHLNDSHSGYVRYERSLFYVPLELKTQAAGKLHVTLTDQHDENLVLAGIKTSSPARPGG